MELELGTAHDESRQKVKRVCRVQWGVRCGEIRDLFLDELIGLGRDAAANQRRFENVEGYVLTCPFRRGLVREGTLSEVRRASEYLG